jgi:hypothetical protein
MDPKTAKLVDEWKGTLSDKEKELHELAEKMLKKNLVPEDEDGFDNGSYYSDKCHSFRAFLKAKEKK